MGGFSQPRCIDFQAKVSPRTEFLRPWTEFACWNSVHGRKSSVRTELIPSMDGKNPSMDGIPGRTDGGRFLARLEFRPWTDLFRPWTESIPSGRNSSAHGRRNSVHGRNSKAEIRPWAELLRPWTESNPSGRNYFAHGRTELFTDGIIPSVNRHGRTDGFLPAPLSYGARGDRRRRRQH